MLGFASLFILPVSLTALLRVGLCHETNSSTVTVCKTQVFHKVLSSIGKHKYR